MIGVWSEYASVYLWVVSIGCMIGFGFPLILFPLKWAGILGWGAPDQTHLTIYLSRCLGCTISVMALFAIIAAGSNPEVLSFYFNFMVLNFIAMIILHIYGALRRIQPLGETIEILFWAVLLVLTLCFHPGSRSSL
jgi:hypothetical protein